MGDNELFMLDHPVRQALNALYRRTSPSDDDHKILVQARSEFDFMERRIDNLIKDLDTANRMLRKGGII